MLSPLDYLYPETGEVCGLRSPKVFHNGAVSLQSRIRHLTDADA